MSLSVAQVLRPKRPRNLKITLAASVVMVVAYLAGSAGAAWSPKRGYGLFFGFLAAALFCFEMTYPFRRPRARPLLTAQNWIQAHVYLGCLAFLAVLIHVDFTSPHGWMGWSLLILSGWTTASGLMGVWLQKRIPARLAEGLNVVALYERIPALVQGLCAEADVLMAGVSDILETFYRTQVRGDLAQVRPSWSHFADVRAGRERALERFRRMTSFVGPAEKEKVSDLMVIYTEKMELDAHYSLQGILRGWLTWTLHAASGGLLLGILAVHILVWVLY